MITKVFLEDPQDPVQFMLDYLHENHGRRPGINTNERMELDFLRKDNLKLKQVVKSATSESTDQESSNDSDNDSSEAEELVADLVQMKAVAQNRKPRTSVSAESFGTWNKKEDFQAPSFEKSAEVKLALKARLQQVFMFNALNPEEFDIVLMAMQNVSKVEGEQVI